MPLSRIVLVAAVGLFALYLLLQFRPRQHQRKALDGSIREARTRAYAAKTPEERARALADAGEASAKAQRWVASAGFFLRAMRADPHSVEVVTRAAESLRTRPRKAEQLLWRRLGALGEGEIDRPVQAAVAGALADLYERPLRDRAKARVMRRLETLEKSA
jgi:hypothetical protein